MRETLSPVQRLPLNAVGVDYVVGDIHGCFDLVHAFMRRVEFNPTTDRLIVAGDLIDRGPTSRLAIDFLKDPVCYSVRGNHEEMIIEYCEALSLTDDHNDIVPVSSVNDLCARNGGQWFLDLPREAKFAYAEAFSALPYAIEVQTRQGKVGVVHAECPVNDWADIEPALTGDNRDGFITRSQWSREHYMKRKNPRVIDGIDHLFVGHTIVSEPTELGNTTYIDLGAYRTGRLCGVRLDTLEFVS